MRNAVGLLLLVAVAALLLAPAAASACPLCKDAKADTDYAGGTASLPRGFYYSILLMVAAPFTVVGGLAFRIYLSRRRKPSVADASGESAPAVRAPDSPGTRP
ncbi:MAG TPA: hypothetical protein VER78_04240 [Thermoanaerobaculia bacterium]|nr:hypothetical protein [Thermoanaerobaculia bacterium]